MTRNWVDVWDGLHGSRDIRAIIEAGTQLRNAVVHARELWADRDRADEVRAVEHVAEVGALQTALENAESDSAGAGLADVVRAWHDIAHEDPWSVCGHVVCRSGLLAFPDARPIDYTDVLLDRTVA